MELASESNSWPCDFPAAQFAKFKEIAPDYPVASEKGQPKAGEEKILVAEEDLEPSQIQDLAEIIPKLLEIKARDKVPFRFNIKIKMGDGKSEPPAKSVKETNALLARIKQGLKLK
jgi:hypothetical protein